MQIPKIQFPQFSRVQAKQVPAVAPSNVQSMPSSAASLTNPVVGGPHSKLGNRLNCMA